MDIDDTIVHTDQDKPSRRVVTAIAKAKKNVSISFATARGVDDMLPMADLLDIRHQYHVVENGAKILTPDGNVAFRYHIPSAEAQQILDICSDLIDDVGFCYDSTWINQLTAPETDTISVISLISFSHEKAAQIPERLASLPISYTAATGKHWQKPSWGLTLISHESATKGKGVQHLQKAMGILPSETIMIGDGMTDLTAFAHAGLKIAMKNGDQALKEAADYVAPSVADDGVADAITKFLLS